MKKKKNNDNVYSAKKSGGIITVAVLIGLIAASVLLSLTVFFKLGNIEVTGKYTSYSAEDIIEAAGIEEGSSLLRIKCGEVEDRIEAELPYLLNVSVYRNLPDTLVIEVNNVEIRLAVACDDGFLLVSDTMKILERSQTAPADCVVVYGIKPAVFSTGSILTDENGLDLDIYLKPLISAADRTDLLTGINSINLSDKLNISMIFDNRLFIEAGTASELDYKFSMIAEVIAKEDRKASGSLNVSIPGKAFFSEGEMNIPSGYYN